MEERLSLSAVFNWMECVRRIWIEYVKQLNQNDTEEKNDLYIKNTLKRRLREHWRRESLGWQSWWIRIMASWSLTTWPGLLTFRIWKSSLPAWAKS